MLESWVKRSLGWMAALLAGLAAVAGCIGGAGPGREQERADTEARLQARAVQARKEVEHVRENVARSDDDAVAARLKSGWVRGGPEDRR